MAGPQPIVIHPPAGDGGRRVRMGDRFVGMAYQLLDVVEFLRLAGLDNVDDDWVRQSELIQWRDAGPDDWNTDQASR